LIGFEKRKAAALLVALRSLPRRMREERVTISKIGEHERSSH
jgi:hypothetical protein